MVPKRGMDERGIEPLASSMQTETKKIERMNHVSRGRVLTEALYH
jgi:hypothetical protein